MGLRRNVPGGGKRVAGTGAQAAVDPQIAQATAALAGIPEVPSLLFVEGGDHGTIMPTKIVSGAHPPVVNFRTGKRPGYSEPSVSAIIFEDGWKQLIPNR